MGVRAARALRSKFVANPASVRGAARSVSSGRSEYAGIARAIAVITPKYSSTSDAISNRPPVGKARAISAANSWVNTRRLRCRFFHHGSGKYTCTACTLPGATCKRNSAFASAHAVRTFANSRIAYRVVAYSWYLRTISMP